MTAVLSGHAKVQALAELPEPSLMSDEMLVAEIDALMRADEESQRRWACGRADCDGLPHEGWLHKHARASQRVPEWFWTTWLMMTGRGWGKTRTAAETVREWARKPNQFIAVIAKNETLVREICFEHRTSGLLAVIPPEEILRYSKSSGNVSLTLKNGTIIRGFGGEVPDNLRGWAFDKAWCDEFAAWNRHTAQDVLDMVWFCLREAASPQIVISTTPKPLPFVKKLVEQHRAQVKAIRESDDPDAQPQVVITQGHMNENVANLSQIALDKLEGDYDGTRVGEQELAGHLLEDVEGALWQRWMLETEGFRMTRSQVPSLDRLVIAVDPATTSTETADESGICVAGRSHWLETKYGDERPHGFVLHSEAQRMTPTGTMKRVAELYHLWKADCVVLEANNGGEYLSTVLRMVDPTVNFRVVHATRDKRARATPVAGLYEQARVHHVGAPKDYDTLETVMTTYVGAPDSQEKSPDILDALVWAMWDLFLDPATAGSPLPGSDNRLDGRR